MCANYNNTYTDYNSFFSSYNSNSNGDSALTTTTTTPSSSSTSFGYNTFAPPPSLVDTQPIALYIFPTKALAQDQLRSLHNFITLPIQTQTHNQNFSNYNQRNPDGIYSLSDWVKCFTYDGDTPQAARKLIQQTANVILTNPDMLHMSILPGYAYINCTYIHIYTQCV